MKAHQPDSFDDCELGAIPETIRKILANSTSSSTPPNLLLIGPVDLAKSRIAHLLCDEKQHIVREYCGDRVKIKATRRIARPGLLPFFNGRLVNIIHDADLIPQKHQIELADAIGRQSKASFILTGTSSKKIIEPLKSHLAQIVL